MSDPDSSDEGGAPVVLVVEDDDALRRVMVRALQREGYEVREAHHSFEARQAQDAVRHVDLVIMDVVLPGMEGREVANLLRAHQPDVKVLFTSGYTSMESRRSGLHAAGEAFLRKPFTVGELLEAVRSALRS